MSDDTFGTPERDFDYQFVQAERAVMDLDAMNREAILSDPLSKEEAQDALRMAFSEVSTDPKLATLVWQEGAFRSNG